MKRIGLFLIAVIAFSILPAMADNFAPPEYAGDPLSYHAQWEFDTDPFPDLLPYIVADGGSNTTETLYSGPEVTKIWTNAPNWTWEDGGIVNNTRDATLEIDVINWVDTEPEKFIRVQLTHSSVSSGFLPPVVVGVRGYKGGTTYGLFEPHSGGVGNSTQSYSDITMQPNPDWETIEIFVPMGTRIDEIVIDTISIPEPSVIVMVLMSGGGLFFVRRKFMI